MAPLVWSTAGKSETLQSLLGLLLEVVWGKVRTALGRDGVVCPEEQSDAVLPGCFLHSPPQGKPADTAPVSGLSEGPCVVVCMGMEEAVKWGLVLNGILSCAFVSPVSPGPEQGHEAAGRHGPEHAGEHSSPA